MKSQRRHELQQNDLADRMANLVVSIKPYTNAILAVVLLVLIGVVATLLWVQRSHGQTVKTWDALYTAVDGESLPDLEDLAGQYPDRAVGHWAAVMAGDMHLWKGCSLLFTNKPEANQELKLAIDCYTKASKKNPNEAIRSRATFGLARAQESMGDLEAAMKSYEELVQNWPNAAYAPMAQRRLVDLARPATKAFWDRFAKFDPKPAYLTDPSMSGQQLPFDENSLSPTDDNLFMPSDPFGSRQPGAQDPMLPELPGAKPGKPAAPPTDPLSPPSPEKQPDTGSTK